jgi:hypothetical protein
VDGGVRDAEGGGRLPRAQGRRLGEVVWTDRLSRAAEGLALRHPPRQPGADALDDPRPLELGNRTEDVHLEPAGGRRGVDPFREADERDAKRLKLVEERDQVLQAATEPIEAPADQHIEPPPLGIGQELIERGAPVLRSAYAAVYELGSGPSARFDVPPQLDQLVVAGLLGGADTGVNGTTRRPTIP